MTDDPKQRKMAENMSGDDAGWSHVAGFARRLDQQLEDAVAGDLNASALDPALWNRIRHGVQPRKSGRGHRSAGSNIRMQKTGSPGGPGTPRPIRPSQWHRGLAAFSLVALIGCVLLILPGGSVETQFGAKLRDAPVILTPEPGVDVGCPVTPLTREQVKAIVVDPTGFDWIFDDRSLFATAPPDLGQSPHTKTWLPEADGTVNLADGKRPVRIPTAKEFRAAESALDLYLRCQEEGTNYQLWALESPVEVQRQILQPIQQTTYETEITETMILDEIDRLGPEPRSGGQYMLVVTPDGPRVQPNPNLAQSYVADSPETGEVEYAWIGTQWVDPETGRLVNTRGASLESTPEALGGAMDNMVVMILRYDDTVNAWLVEWLVPTI